MIARPLVLSALMVLVAIVPAVSDAGPETPLEVLRNPGLEGLATFANGFELRDGAALVPAGNPGQGVDLGVAGNDPATNPAWSIGRVVDYAKPGVTFGTVGSFSYDYKAAGTHPFTLGWYMPLVDPTGTPKACIVYREDAVSGLSPGVWTTVAATAATLVWTTDAACAAPADLSAMLPPGPLSLPNGGSAWTNRVSLSAAQADPTLAGLMVQKVALQALPIGGGAWPAGNSIVVDNLHLTAASGAGNDPINGAIQTVQDAVDGATKLVQDVGAGPGSPSLTFRPFGDFDHDGRADAFWYRMNATDPVTGTPAVACGVLQVDYVYDGADRGTTVSLVNPDGSPRSDMNVRGTVMLYNGTGVTEVKPGTWALADRQCPEDPSALPAGSVPHVVLDEAAHVEFINNGATAPEGTPTSVKVYDGNDVLIDRVDLFQRDLGATRNPGTHLVLRSYTIGQPDDSKELSSGLTVDVFPLRPDFTNVHLVSGTGATSQIASRHDLDDDGFSDLNELQGAGYGASNPLNASSVPNDLDGDGHANAQDKYPTDPTRFRDFDHKVTLTSPSSGQMLSGNVSVDWTVVSNASGIPIDHFDLYVQQTTSPVTHTLIASGLPADRRHFTWDTWATRNQIPDDLGGDYRLRINATDAGSPPLVQANQTGLFNLQVKPTPGAGAVAVADANGHVDHAGYLTGAITATFSGTRRLTGSDLSYAATLYKCPTAATAHGTLIKTLTGTVAADGVAQSVTFDWKTVHDGFGDGRVTCPSPVLPGTARIRVVITETQGGWSESSAATADFRVFFNQLPTLSVPTATQNDVGDNSAQGGSTTGANLKGTGAFFTVKYKDLDATAETCANKGAQAPSSIKLFVLDKATNAAIPGSPFTMTKSANTNPQVCIPSVLLNGDYGAGVQFEAKLANLPRGNYSWHVEAIDVDGNTQDGVVKLPATTTAQDYTQVPDSTSGAVKTVRGVRDTVTDAVNRTFDCQPNDAPATCLERYATSQADSTVKAIEDKGNCDIPGVGGNDHTEPCTDKPGDLVNNLVTILKGKADEISQQILDAANQASKQGLPNPYPFANCDLVANVAGDKNQGCNSEDHDRDGYTDAEEAGVSDPYNPYSQPGDRNADLIPDVVQIMADVHLYHIRWMNTTSANAADWHDCGATDRQSDCQGKLEVYPSPQKYVAVYPALGLTKGQRLPYLLNVSEESGNVVRVSSQVGCAALGGQAPQIGCGFSWTFPGTLLTGPTFSQCNFADQPPNIDACKITMAAKAEDNEKAFDLTVDLGALHTQGDLVKVTFLGGKRTQADQQVLAVRTSPLTLAHNGEAVQDTVYNLNSKVQSGTPPAACDASSPQSVQGTGTWIRTDKTPDEKWRVCGQVNANNPSAPPETFWQETPAHFQPVVGFFVNSNGQPVVWMDKDGDRSYEPGEELTTLCSGGQTPDQCALGVLHDTLGCQAGDDLPTCLGKIVGGQAGCKSGQPVDQCASEKAVEALGCPAGESLQDCATTTALSTLGCQVGDDVPTCLAKIVGDKAGCKSGQSVEECGSDKAVQALGCPAGQSLQDCATATVLAKLGCTATQTLQDCVTEKGLGCPAGQSIEDCATTTVLASLGCTTVATLQDCVTQKALSTLGCPATYSPDQCAASKAGCTAGETLADCATRMGKGAVDGVPVGGPCTASETATDCLLRKVTSAASDLDGDGASNTAELSAGSNPFYKLSTPTSKGGGFPGDWDADRIFDQLEVDGAYGHRSDPFEQCSTPYDNRPHNVWPNDYQSCEPGNPL